MSLDDHITKHSKNLPISQDPHQEFLTIDQISKLVLDERTVKTETLPNAMTIGGPNQIGVRRIKPVVIPSILLSHPALERGIEFKFNRMITQLDRDDIGNNIIPKNTSKLAIEAKEMCSKILKDSHNQPVSWLKQFGRDAMRFGDNYAVFVRNRRRKIVRWELQNPIFFSPSFTTVGGSSVSSVNSIAYREQDDVRYLINPKTKDPISYTQLKKLGSDPVTLPISTSDPRNMQFVSFGKPIPESRVIQLNFDRIGDEPFGIPLAQTLFKIIEQILRVEDAGTETMIAFGYNRWIANTPFRTVEKMQSFAKSIENIRKRSVVLLPEGVKLENIKPGSTEFDKVHNILLTLIAMRIGISILQLKGEGGDINKATLGELNSDIRYDFFADELEMAAKITEGFVKTCKINFNLTTPKEIENFPYPVFRFFDMEEDKEKLASLILKETLALRNLTVSIDKLIGNGFNEEATLFLNAFIKRIIPNEKTQDGFVKKKTQVLLPPSNKLILPK